MYRDTSNLTFYDCTAIIDDQTIIIYDDTTYFTYKLITDKYYLIRTDSGTPIIGSVTCYTEAQIETLPSKYDFVDPIYHMMAIISALFIFYVAYKLLIYPFFRTKT